MDEDEPTGPLSASEFVAAAVRVAVADYPVLLGCSAIAVVPSVTLGALLLTTAVHNNAHASSSASLPTVIVGVAVVALGSLLAQAFGAPAALAVTTGDRLGVRGSLRIGLRRAPTVLATAAVIAALTAVGVAAFLVPGVYAYLAWFVAMPALIFEPGLGLNALRRSADLTVGRRMTVLGAYLLFIGVFTLIAVVVAVLLRGTSAPVDDLVVQQLITGVTQLVLAPFEISLAVIAYLECRRVSDGATPESIARVIGVPVNPT
jgi:hypothetical protein